MYTIFGIIATIVAAAKGRTGFAWFTGIWTALAIFMVLIGEAQYAISPGGLILIIAICMKKQEANAQSGSGQGKNSSAVSNPDPSKKFVCKKCGNFSSGWYQTCPHCGAVGAMEKNTLAIEPPSNDPAIADLAADSELEPKGAIPHEVSPTIMFCRECGTKLLPDASFCPECGTRIVSDVKPFQILDSTEPPASRALPTHSDLDEKKENDPVQPFTIPMPNSNLSPTLRRAFLLIEDEEWDKADNYLERVLDNEPENAYAYLGKLLIEVGADSIEKLPDFSEKIITSRNYKKALRYAEDNQLKSFLQQFNHA